MPTGMVNFVCHGCKRKFTHAISKLILTGVPNFQECPFCGYNFTKQAKASWGVFGGLDINNIYIDEVDILDNDFVPSNSIPQELYNELKQLYNDKLIDSTRFKQLYDEIMQHYKDFKAKFAENPTFVNIMELKFRLKIAKDVPIRTNYLLIYNLMENIIIAKYKKAEIEIDDKQFDRLEKFKNLALGTVSYSEGNNERKVAFEMSLNIFQKIAKIEL